MAQKVVKPEQLNTLTAMADEPQYLLPEPEKEIAPLTEQDAVINYPPDEQQAHLGTDRSHQTGPTDSRLRNG